MHDCSHPCIKSLALDARPRPPGTTHFPIRTPMPHHRPLNPAPPALLPPCPQKSHAELGALAPPERLEPAGAGAGARLRVPAARAAFRSVQELPQYQANQDSHAGCAVHAVLAGPNQPWFRPRAYYPLY